MRGILRSAVTGALGILVCVGLLGGSAAADTISIQATSITSGNILSYFGLGDVGGGVGHGTYQLGSCAYDGVSRTNCTTTGSYVELAGSRNPGATGTFTWNMTWLGNGPNPIQTESISAGSNILQLYSVPAGAYFEVSLSSGAYANLDFGAADTPNPTGGQLNWQAFLGPNAVCTGSPATCSVGSVGLKNGSSISSTISPFNMQLTYPNTTTLPEPSSMMLIGTGIVALVARRLKK